MARQNKDQKVDNFRLALIEDQTHKQLWAFRFTRMSFVITMISVVVAICLSIFCIIAYTPIRTFIPGYPDSLENVINTWELYSENLSRVVDGKQPLRLDSLIRSNSSTNVSEKDAKEMAKKDSLLRSDVKKAEQFGVTGNRTRDLQIAGMHFFVPLRGVISQGYDKVLHPYIDITAPASSEVMAVMNGTVVFAGWDDEAGYTIQIQHSNDIISIYKHNQTLLKRIGDKVSAGTPIALLGNTGSLTTGDHLHFELWYKGEAVDPTKYINF
jgi:murein DD-endopeptidase MepM/ murein hydrolase activator NlpD